MPGWIIERDPTPAGNGIWSQQDVWGIWVEEFEGQYEEGGFFNLAEYWLAQGH